MTAGEKNLAPRMEAAIVALLTEATQAEAAEKAGVSPATLQRWLRRQDFLDAYRAARRCVLERSIGQLQLLTQEAVAALKRNMTCGRPAVEVKAALAVLDTSFKGAELLDLVERIAAVEEQLAAAGKSGRRRA